MSQSHARGKHDSHGRVCACKIFDFILVDSWGVCVCARGRACVVVFVRAFSVRNTDRLRTSSPQGDQRLALMLSEVLVNFGGKV